ncbi:MAG: Smr/MutS family protein [candidate division Zixibacteria bacterium]|nr:Smr/MutS family protein [candidate division Zixibacteria bacterium]
MCSQESEPVEYPIDGTLDLHTFSPSEVRDLIQEYIETCRRKDITRLRIIHGKGKGTLRQIVQSILEQHPQVVRFWQEGGSGGSWGATIVNLKPKE